MLLEGFNSILGLIFTVMTVLAVVAFIMAAIAREDAYRAADKQTKAFWLIILGLAFVVNLIFNILSFLPIIGLIATIVYMVDVRPAIRALPGGGRSGGGRGSSSDGPYGPYNGGR